MGLAPPAVLACHPSTPCESVRRIEVRVRGTQRELSLAYRIEGDLSALCIPERCPPRRADGLWQSTCLETFIRGPGEGYCEFNFAPSTAWAAYRFAARRQGRLSAELVEPIKIAVRHDAHQLELETMVRLDSLPLPKAGTLRMGLSAVIKEQHGRLSYWALAHPQGEPDFHHPDSFAFEFSPDP